MAERLSPLRTTTFCQVAVSDGMAVSVLTCGSLETAVLEPTAAKPSIAASLMLAAVALTSGPSRWEPVATGMVVVPDL